MIKKKRKKMEHYELFLEIEKKNIGLSKKHYTEELDSYVECFNLLTDTFVHLCDILKPLNYVQACVLFNCGRMLSSLGVYIDLLMKGHYFDAYIIRRSLLENVFLLECFVKDEQYAEKWVKQELKLSKIKKELDLYTWEAFVEYYNDMCDFVHANVPAILTFVELGKSPEAKLYYTPKFKLDPAIAIHFFPLVGYMMLSNLHKAYGNLMNPKIKIQVEKSLMKWKIEVDELYDKVKKEFGKKAPN